jgi:sucrose-6-phosphate hydrolase SacC (GH32 family)
VIRGDWAQAGLRLSNAQGESVTLGVTAQPLELFVDRRSSRKTSWHKDYPGRHTGALRWRDGRISLRVLFDRSVIEIFGNDGETVISERVYPTRPYDRVELLPEGRSSTDARMWELRSVWTAAR